MFIKQIYTSCLAEAAYYIESEGDAAIIDPLRDINAYIDLARERNTTIKYVFETHFHADFVSGHLDLARQTGAKIIYGPTANADFEFHESKDGEEFILGDLLIRALHTPGHTLESTCFLLLGTNYKPHAIFTGDTLFVGDVGRPDLAVGSEQNINDLAGLLYDSIKQKILSLPDNVIVFPGHGAGSQCGKNLSEETASTVGTQRRSNYALKQPDRDSFIKAVTENIIPPPQYFFKNALINKTGYDQLDKVLAKELNPLSVDQFKNEIQNGALIIDARNYRQYCEGHIEKSINIGHDGFFAVWVGTLIEDLKTPIILVTEESQEEETIVRLARVGYENVRGYLLGGMESWLQNSENVSKVPSINAGDFQKRKDDYPVFDVRNASEMDNSVKIDCNIPLVEIEKRASEFCAEKCYLLCKSGYRSTIAASILQKLGHSNVINVTGGTDAIINK